MEYIVVPKVGSYAVHRESDLAVWIVGKDKNCSCGGTGNDRCEHIEAVSNYLRSGGRIAPDTPLPQHTAVGECPICGEQVEPRPMYRRLDAWRCPEDSSHYWLWRGERSGAKAFLTGGRPTGIPAIDDMEGSYAEYLDELWRNRGRGD
jgi:hypothetical protein